ncbi:NB-ARC domain-containing protein [Parafrankia sp. FMc2]|uniref:NB-ARC domain-containing protein n=1 Tax=Parafrankia sp. FMc2 TaxID=3233196 RepID=UPI0034D557FE
MPAWRVFLSHTSELRELPADRSFVQASEDAVKRLEHAPVDMDYFVAEDDDPARMCRRRVANCDLYVGIIGFRYGSPVAGMPGVSYTELEFDTATDLGIERLVFLLDEARTVGVRRLFHDPVYWERQEAFRRRLLGESRITIRLVASPDELEKELLLSLGEVARRRAAAASAASALSGPSTPSARRTAATGAGASGSVATSPVYWIPDLTTRVVDRPGLLAPLVRALTGGDAGVVAVHGAGGYGKTTLAHMACRNEDLRSDFPDGILWTDIGPDIADARLAEKINGLCRRLGDDHPGPSDPLQAGMRLGELLAGRRMLLVVDDVWSREQLTPFRQGGPDCRRLVTTRDRATLPLDCPVIAVDLMRLDQAVRLLRGRVPELADSDARALAERCGRWPVLLRLIAGHLFLRVEAGMPVGAALEEAVRDLDEAGPAAFDDQGRLRAVAATVEASLRLLHSLGAADDSPLARYLELVVFPQGTVVPREVLEVMWKHTAGWSPLRTRRFCDRLAELSLIRAVRGDNAGTPGVRLHDVMHRYIRERVGPELRSAHARLLAAYRAELGQSAPSASALASTPADPAVRRGSAAAWWRLSPSNNYLWANLALHLREAGEHAELTALAHDLRWAAMKIHLAGSVTLEADLALLPGDLAAQALGRLARQIANLHQATDDPAVTMTTLAVYAAGVDVLGEAAERLFQQMPRPHLRPTVPPLPDQPDPALACTLTGHRSHVAALVLAPDASWLASGGGGEFFGGGDGSVRIWNPAAGEERMTLPGHPGGVSALVAAPDGSWLASAGRDGSIRRWELATGAEEALGTHVNRVSALVIAPDGAWLASGGLDATVRLWDPDRGERGVLSGHTGWVSALAVAPDGSWFASGGGDGTVRIWDPADGRQLAVLAAHSGWVSALAVAPDGSWLASAGGDHTVRLWERAGGRRIAELAGHAAPVSALAVAPDGSWLASGGGDGSVRIWDPLHGTVRAAVDGHAGRVSMLVAAPDSAWLASSGGEGSVRVWDPASGERRALLTGHTEGFVALAVAAGSGLLASAGDDGVVRIWDPAAGGALRAEPAGRITSSITSVAALAAAADGSWAAAGTQDGQIQLWDPRTGAGRVPLTGHSGHVDVLAAAPDSSWMASADGDGTVRIWDMATGLARASRDAVTGRSPALAVAPDSSWLAVGAADGTVRIWDPTGGGELAVLAGHTGWVSALAVAPDASWLASGATDGTVRIWDPVGGRELRTLTGHTGWVSTLAVAPDASWLASGAVDATVRVWDPATGRQLALLGGHTDGVADLLVAPDGSWFASVGRDRTLRVWNPFALAAGPVLAGRGDTVSAAAVAPDGRWIAAVGREGTIRIWDPVGGDTVTMIRLNGPLHACTWAAGAAAGSQVIVGGSHGLYLLDLVASGGVPRG